MAAPQLTSPKDLPLLQEGERLDQKTFHARYEGMPPHVKAELIEGVVHMPSPLKTGHGRPHGRLMSWLGLYQEATPGTDFLDNATVILGEWSEPQPDACLFLLRDFGGQAGPNEQDYLEGAPELVAEVALSSRDHDLHGKLRDYQQAGVREYLVLVVPEERAAWFVRGEQGFVPLEAGKDGILRSPFFAGLWLDAEALLRGDSARVHEVLRQGLASPEHARLVERLQRPR